MLVKLGPVIAEARGKVGGAVFSRNGAGAYVRQWIKPVDPSSARQNLARARMTSCLAAWRALTAAQRGAFNDSAKRTAFPNALGDPVAPSGFNLYARGYMLLDICAMAQVTVPPVQPNADPVDSVASFDAVDGFIVSSTTSSWVAGASLLVQYAIDLPNSVFSFKGPFTSTIALVAADFTANEAVLVALVGLQIGSAMFAQMRMVTPDGAASAPRISRAFYPPA